MERRLVGIRAVEDGLVDKLIGRRLQDLLVFSKLIVRLIEGEEILFVDWFVHFTVTAVFPLSLQALQLILCCDIGT